MTTPTPADVAAASQGRTSVTPPAEPPQQQDDGGSGFDPNSPSISQNHMNHLLAEQKRLFNNRFGDYDSLKERAERFDALVATTQTAEEQASDLTARLATRDRDVTDRDLVIARQRLAAEAGIAPALWDMIGGGDDDTIKANIALLKQHTAAAQAPPADGQQRRRTSPGQGRPPEGGADAGAGGSISSGRDLYASRQKKKGA